MIELAAWRGREVRIRRKQPERPVEDEPKKSPPPLALQLGDPRARGPGRHPRATAPLCGRAAVPAAPGSPADRFPRGPRNKTRTKFPSQAGRERSRPGSRASKHGRGWSGAQAGGDGKGSESKWTSPLPKDSEMPPSGTRALQIPRAKDCSLTPTF